MTCGMTFIMLSTIYAENNSSSFFDTADSSRILNSLTTDRGLENTSLGKNMSDRWLRRSEGEEVDENCLQFSHSRNCE